jgi:predicted acylesterase/phospholipase RssA
MLPRIAKAVLICTACAACALPRAQFDERQQAKAQLPGYPAVRAFADSTTDKSTVGQPRKVEYKSSPTVLALSGGGADGAFGAGVLSGWSETKQRPEFTIVSGVSTGALIAPFAFLGPAYDSVLREMYTSGYAEEFVRAAHYGNALFGTGLISAERAKAIISHFIDQHLIDDIAREHRKGRRLFVVTTNLDAQRPVVWDLGAIAASGRADARSVFSDVLTASASFPGAFSPVLINVEADGQNFAEMHADGAMTAPIFVGTERTLKSLAAAPASARKSIYVLINTKFEPSFEVTASTSWQVSSRALWTLVRAERVAGVQSIYEFARRNGFGFNLTYIPKDISGKGSTEFDTGYMRSLFDYGYKLGLSGRAWRSSLPRPD